MTRLIKGLSIICILLILFSSGCSSPVPGENVNEEEQRQNAVIPPTREDNAKADKGQNHEKAGRYTGEDSNTGKASKDNHVEKEPETVSIVAVGDIMCHRDNLRSAYDSERGTYDFTGFFEYVKPYISEADLAIANLETVTAGEAARYSSYPLFNTPDAILEALHNTGFDVLVTANNHCLDRGRDGLARTIEKIQENNMVHTGTTSEQGIRFITRTVKGLKVSILAYTYGCNGNLAKLNKDEREFMVNLIDEKRIKEDIDKAKAQDSDVIIVCMHWGVEYNRVHNKYQTDLARKLSEWGVDIVLGSHPHVIQKSEIMEGQGGDMYVVYSMGNFISNYRREEQGNRKNKEYTEDGVIVRIILEKKDEAAPCDVIIRNVAYIPTWVDKYMEDGKNVFKILPIPDAIPDEGYINDRNRERVQESYEHTMELMQDFK